MSAQPKNVRFTDRDRQILEDISLAGGLLDSKAIHQRRFPSDTTGEACLRRIRLLRGQQVLWCVQASVTFGVAPVGRLPLVLGLTPKGADLLEELTGKRPGVVAQTLSSQHLEHRLGMGHLRLLVNDACDKESLASPIWIGEYDPRPGIRPFINDKLSKRFRLCHQYVSGDNVLTCWPDAACLLGVPSGSSIHQFLILWEYDRSTERLAQVRGKFPAYERFIGSNDHLGLFQSQDRIETRIFFVTQSEERWRNIADAIKEFPISACVRFGVRKDISPASFFREPIWSTPDGQSRAILRTGRNP